MARDFARSLGDVTVGGPEGRHLDLREANRLALLAEGLRPSHIEVDPRCTYDNPALFYSYRRDAGLAGRMLTFALRAS